MESTRVTELKFVLYDMFITGLEIDEICKRTTVPIDEIEQAFKDVDLRDFMDTMIYDSDDEDAELFKPSRGRSGPAERPVIDTTITAGEAKP